MNKSFASEQEVLPATACASDGDLRIRREPHACYSERSDDFPRPGDRTIPAPSGGGPSRCRMWAGRFSPLPAGEGHSGFLAGCDLSEGMIEQVREDSLKISWLVADNVQLPFLDGAFQAVLARHMLYHVANIAQGVAELARVVAPAGWVAVTTNSRDSQQLGGALWRAIDHPKVIDQPFRRTGETVGGHLPPSGTFAALHGGGVVSDSTGTI